MPVPKSKYLHGIRDTKGFTIIELLLVISIIAIFIVSFVITYRTSRANQALRTSAEKYADVVRNAHVFAREAADKKGWGVVKNNDTQYSLISGSSTDWSVVTNYTLESQVVFEDDFFLWFDIGTGELESSQTVVLVVDGGKRIPIEILQTGIVNVGSIL